MAVRRADQSITILDQAAILAGLAGRHRHGRQLAEGRHPGQLQGVVAVGLALDLAPGPRLAHRVGDGVVQAQPGAEVGDPAGDGAGLEDDQAGPLGLQESAEGVGVGEDGREACRGRLGVVGAGDALELAEVEAEAENGAHGRVAPSEGVKEMSHLGDTP